MAGFAASSQILLRQWQVRRFPWLRRLGDSIDQNDFLPLFSATHEFGFAFKILKYKCATSKDGSQHHRHQEEFDDIEEYYGRNEEHKHQK